MVKIHNEDIKLVQSILGRSSLVHATGIVKVYVSQNGFWNQICVGVACIVTDLYAKSHFLKVIDITNHTIPFSQEFYQNFLYSCPKNFFHTFEIDNSVAGFSFADEMEACAFYEKVMEIKTIPAYALISEPPIAHEKPAGPMNSISSPALLPQNHNETTSNQRPQSLKRNKIMSLFSKSKENNKNSNMNISGPTNFRHISGIGWNPRQGAFEIRNIPPEWKQLFMDARVTPKDLQDRETAGIIMNAIEKFTGSDLRNSFANAPPLPEHRPAPPTLRPVPVPPKLVVQAPIPPPIRVSSNPSVVATSNVAPISNIPPAVQQRPLPIPPKAVAPPPPVIPEIAPEVVSEVSSTIPPPPPPRRANIQKETNHTNLFDQIKNGHTLKKTEPQVTKPAIDVNDDSLAATIARAIDKRRKIMREDVVEESVEDAWKDT